MASALLSTRPVRHSGRTGNDFRALLTLRRMSRSSAEGGIMAPNTLGKVVVLVISVVLGMLKLPAQADGRELGVERRAEQGQEQRMGQRQEHATSYRTVQVDGLSIFYREAGPKDAPTLLLLHGLPSSSRMFAPLFARLSDRYHLVAPDYPGFGHSSWPGPKTFAYTFDHYAEIMNHFTQVLGLSHYTLYMQDYGGRGGFGWGRAFPG